jgi:hypothetical protein
MMDDKVSGTNDASFNYVSLIAGGTDKTAKLSNIQPLNKGENGDNFNERTYSKLLKDTNDSTENSARKQRAMDIFGKVYGYRQRIDEILAMMRAQTKDDAAYINTVRISESVVQELRTMLSYLAIIQRTDAIIKFEESIDFGNNVKGIYNKLNTTPPLSSLDNLPLPKENDIRINILQDNNIFRIPLDDDTYNTNDEKRYVYGITYYFDTEKSKNPY